MFQPLINKRLNLFHPAEHENYALCATLKWCWGMKRERFSDWLERVNNELQVGHRVIGNFETSEVNSLIGGKNSRVSPKRQKSRFGCGLHFG